MSWMWLTSSCSQSSKLKTLKGFDLTGGNMWKDVLHQGQIHSHLGSSRILGGGSHQSFRIIQHPKSWFWSNLLSHRHPEPFRGLSLHDVSRCSLHSSANVTFLYQFSAMGINWRQNDVRSFVFDKKPKGVDQEAKESKLCPLFLCSAGNCWSESKRWHDIYLNTADIRYPFGGCHNWCLGLLLCISKQPNSSSCHIVWKDTWMP